MKVLIVGAGVAGLAIGWRLAQAGCAVEVYERGLAGRQCTWAAAGMLAATAETGTANDAHAQLARRGLAQWPAFARELEAASGCSIGFRHCGTVLVALDSDRADALLALARKLKEQNEPVDFLTPEAALAREPTLTPELTAALYVANDAQVDNRALGPALSTALRRAGGVLHELCPVRALHIEKNRVCGVTTQKGMQPADCVIVAAGAWASLLEGAGADALPPVRPAKGQMVALTSPNGAAAPGHLVWGPDIYIVPQGGAVMLGGTVEDCGFDTSVTKEACAALVERAVRVVPGLVDWRVNESWAGLRPLTPDENPVLGATSLPGLFVAGGQFRNGILFAPVVAEILCRFILGGTLEPLATAFDPRRFSGH